MTTRKFGRTLLVAALALSLVLSITGGTIAWFTDSVESSTNVITAGNLDVELYAGTTKVGNTTALFDDVALWEPGAVTWENLTVKNEGTLHLYYDLGINVTGENYVVDGDKQYGLSTALKMAVVDDGIPATATTREAVMALVDEGAPLATASHIGNLAAGASKTYGVIIYWEPSANDNNWNANNGKTLSSGDALTITLGVKLNATQQNFESDAFDPNYDMNAKPVLKANDVASLKNAMRLGGTVVLTDNITLVAGENLEVAEGANVILNMNGKKITGTSHKNDGAVVKNNGTLTVEGGVIASTANNGGSAIQNAGTLTVKNATLNGAPNADGSWPSYTVNNTGKAIIENTKITSYHGAVASYGNGAQVTLNNSEIDMSGIPGFTSHGIYTYNSGSVIVNGGTYANKATDQNASGASVINGAVTVNAGTFSGRIENYYGTPVIKGGIFSVKPNANFIATGYKSEESNGKYFVIPEDSATANTGADLTDAINNGKDVVLTADVTYGTAIKNDAKIDLAGNTFEPTGTIELKNNADLTMIGGDYEVNGTYGHVDVRPSEGSAVVFEDVHFSYNKLNKTYGPSTNRLGSVVEVCATVAEANTDILFKNCTFDNAQVLFEGMSGKTGTFEATFENCTFNALTSSAPIYVQNYVKGTITVKNCTFNLEVTSSTASAISISSSSSTEVELNLEGTNTLNAKAATPSGVDGTVEQIKVNGTPANIKLVSSYENTTVNENGTIVVTGIATK